MDAPKETTKEVIPNDIVLLTGASGYVGSLVLVRLLKAGYTVRCAIRSEGKKDKVLGTDSIKALKPSREQLSWIVVRDLAAPGAYDEAAVGVKYIIHCASPIPSFGEGEHLQPSNSKTTLSN